MSAWRRLRLMRDEDKRYWTINVVMMAVAVVTGVAYGLGFKMILDGEDWLIAYVLIVIGASGLVGSTSGGNYLVRKYCPERYAKEKK